MLGNPMGGGGTTWQESGLCHPGWMDTSWLWIDVESGTTVCCLVNAIPRDARVGTAQRKNLSAFALSLL